MLIVVNCLSAEVRLNGETALEAARDPAGGYDVMLLDICMPNMDGYEVARRIRYEKKAALLPPALYLNWSRGGCFVLYVPYCSW
jgi:CheY-like chemotaxis protein